MLIIKIQVQVEAVLWRRKPELAVRLFKQWKYASPELVSPARGHHRRACLLWVLCPEFWETERSSWLPASNLWWPIARFLSGLNPKPQAYWSFAPNYFPDVDINTQKLIFSFITYLGIPFCVLILYWTSLSLQIRHFKKTIRVKTAQEQLYCNN